ncbi:MAG: PIN domain-containing protein, partial [Parafilimonas sp.]
WIAAETLVENIDPKDTHYIAFSKPFRCKIWSGDKVLMKGLENKGFKDFITTNDLYKLREQESKKI